MQNQNTEHLTEHRAANDVDSYSEQQEQTKKLHALNFANFMKERGYIYLNRSRGRSFTAFGRENISLPRGVQSISSMVQKAA
jgi:hypothetical protein